MRTSAVLVLVVMLATGCLSLPVASPSQQPGSSLESPGPSGGVATTAPSVSGTFVPVASPSLAPSGLAGSPTPAPTDGPQPSSDPTPSVAPSSNVEPLSIEWRRRQGGPEGTLYGDSSVLSNAAVHDGRFVIIGSQDDGNEMSGQQSGRQKTDSIGRRRRSRGSQRDQTQIQTGSAC